MSTDQSVETIKQFLLESRKGFEPPAGGGLEEVVPHIRHEAGVPELAALLSHAPGGPGRKQCQHEGQDYSSNI